MIGIYLITNRINNKKYVGQSINITQRWRSHRTNYHTGDTYLYRAIRKYGLESFSFEVITECAAESLDELEKYWIKQYNSNDPEYGYNLTEGGDSLAETLTKITDEQIWLIYDMLREGKAQQEIAAIFNVTQQQISLINLGESRPQVGVAYPIVNNKAQQKYCVDCGKEISSNALRCHSCDMKMRLAKTYADKPSRSELKEKIRTSTFAAIGREYNVSDNAVRKWCDHYGLPRRSKDIKALSNDEWEKL